MATIRSGSQKQVDKYIAAAPQRIKTKLKQLRAIIREIAPGASERISYRMPCFDCKGPLAWFALQKGYIGLYIRPPVIEQHKKLLSAYKTTMSAIHFPLEEDLPVQLIERLIKARLKLNEEGE